MRHIKNCPRCLKLAILGLLLLPELAGAQTYFQYSQYGDVLLGFRKTGTHQGTNELVVNIGNVTNLVALPAGTQISVPNFSAARLTAAFGDGNGDLQWSASTSFRFSSPWVTPVGTFPQTTLWYTLASSGTNTQSTPPARSSTSGQGLTRQSILSVGSGASTISTALGTTNADNNTLLVREPLTSQYLGSQLTVYIGDQADSTIGDFNTANVVENTTPHTFTTAVRSDFYQSCPTGLVDPITSQTTGNAYFVGYFLLNPNGSMTFTRASNNVRIPPPPVQLSITGAGAGAYNISFTSSNSAIYTLYYTNAAGLTSPKSTWPTNATTITGDGNVKTFTVNPAGSPLFYIVGGQ